MDMYVDVTRTSLAQDKSLAILHYAATLLPQAAEAFEQQCFSCVPRYRWKWMPEDNLVATTNPDMLAPGCDAHLNVGDLGGRCILKLRGIVVDEICRDSMPEKIFARIGKGSFEDIMDDLRLVWLQAKAYAPEREKTELYTVLSLILTGEWLPCLPNGLRADEKLPAGSNMESGFNASLNL